MVRFVGNLYVQINQFYSKMIKTEESQLLSYRNAHYHGQVKDGKRHGSGILIMDEGPIIIANWKQDLSYGPAFSYLNSEQYAFLQFNRGELEGICIFKSGPEMLVMQFSNGRSIDNQWHANYEENKAKILSYRNANYQVLETVSLQGQKQSTLIQHYLGINIVIPTLQEYLQQHFCKKGQQFEIKMLPNGTKCFKYCQKSKPISLGFVLGRNDQLVSYGSYINDKLHGFGCKYENNTKYEGQFENGFLNGEGMRLSNGKYSYGRFENGNLVEALFLEERSSASQQRLKQLKRIHHIGSTNFHNAYVKKNILRFKGIAEVTSMSSPIKQYLYSNNIQNHNPMNSSSVSLNQLLSAKAKKGEDIETKSILRSSQTSKGRNPQDFQLQPRRMDNNYMSTNQYQSNPYGRKFNN